jgi:hypothetical protein
MACAGSPTSPRSHEPDDRVVAGELAVPVDGTPYPWRIQVGDAVFALDLLRTIEPRRLPDRAGRAGNDTVAAVRRALGHIT